eukprot:6191409-Pyramimonas_sp.AAC.1
MALSDSTLPSSDYSTPWVTRDADQGEARLTPDSWPDWRPRCKSLGARIMIFRHGQELQRPSARMMIDTHVLHVIQRRDCRAPLVPEDAA